jgi:3D (Asp-Asp-Asp) domain-containing protein
MARVLRAGLSRLAAIAELDRWLSQRCTRPIGSAGVVVAIASVLGVVAIAIGGGCGPRSPARTKTAAIATPTAVAPLSTSKTAGPESPIERPALAAAPVRITLYHLATQPCPDAPQVALPRCGGGAIARVSSAFLRSARMQGSARLCDGRVVNVHKLSPLCFAVVDETHVWGTTASGRPASPFRSIAVDPKRFAIGRWYYLPELAGVALPPPAEGKIHDGCVRADDVGAAIKGELIDLFVGTTQALDAMKVRFSDVTVHLAEAGDRCDDPPPFTDAPAPP